MTDKPKRSGQPTREKQNIPPIEECIKGRLYEIRCRNLTYGVFDGKDGFIGIREKFGDRYLFTEHHWDAPAFATVGEALDTGIDVPEEIGARETVGYFTDDGAAVYSKPSDDPLAMHWAKDWFYEATDIRVSKEKEVNIRARSNQALFHWLEQKEEELYPTSERKKRYDERLAERERKDALKKAAEEGGYEICHWCCATLTEEECTQEKPRYGGKHCGACQEKINESNRQRQKHLEERKAALAKKKAEEQNSDN